MGKLDPNLGKLIFTPHLLPVDRGLMTSIYVQLGADFKATDAHKIYAELYDDEPLIDLLPLGAHATLKHVVKTNKCAVSLTPIDEDMLHITSVTDNLRKGAAGQAVQNFNLMCGFPEVTALL